MSKTNIETLITNDLETFLHYKSQKGNVSIEDAIEIAAYVGANFLRIIFHKNKELKPEELNGVFGIISNVYNDLFQNQMTQSDYQEIFQKASTLLKDTNFDQKSKDFFSEIVAGTD